MVMVYFLYVNLVCLYFGRYVFRFMEVIGIFFVLVEFGYFLYVCYVFIYLWLRIVFWIFIFSLVFVDFYLG